MKGLTHALCLSFHKITIRCIPNSDKNILAMVEENEQLIVPTFIAFVRQEFEYTIIYRKAWLAKQWALEKVYGN